MEADIHRKIAYHQEQQINANNWNSFFVIGNYILVGASTLTLLLVGLVDKNPGSYGLIIGGVSTFLIGLLAKLQSNYEFNVLAVKHQHVSDEFAGLILSLRSEPVELVELKYINTLAKSHHQHTRKCWSILCCNR